MASAERERIRGSGAEPPTGSRGRACRNTACRNSAMYPRTVAEISHFFVKCKNSLDDRA